MNLIKHLNSVEWGSQNYRTIEIKTLLSENFYNFRSLLFLFKHSTNTTFFISRLLNQDLMFKPTKE